MKKVITAVVINVELTIYNDEGQVTPRPQVQPLVVFEVDIPEPVREWLWQRLPQSGGAS